MGTGKDTTPISPGKLPPANRSHGRARVELPSYRRVKTVDRRVADTQLLGHPYQIG